MLTVVPSQFRKSTKLLHYFRYGSEIEPLTTAHSSMDLENWLKLPVSGGLASRWNVPAAVGQGTGRATPVAAEGPAARRRRLSFLLSQPEIAVAVDLSFRGVCDFLVRASLSGA